MALVVDRLSFGYGSRPVLDALSTGTLARGTLAALVGPNGSGKSTLFRCIAGTVARARGSARLDGAELFALDAATRSRRVFHLTQDLATASMLSVFEVVLLARKSLPGASGLRTSAAELAAVETTLAELGVDGLQERAIGTLSGGQRQLVGIAQALVREPDVLLLDEPTSALDVRRQLEVMVAVRRVTRERGIVTIAAMHDLSLAARFADRLLLLKDGGIAAEGRPVEVLQSAAVADTYGVGIHLEHSRRGTLLVESYLPEDRAAE